MIRHGIFEPQEVKPEHQDRIIVMPNEIGASLQDTHAAWAQGLANGTGARVLAYERPLSATEAKFSLRARHVATHNIAGINAHTALQIGKLLDREGAKHVAAVGNSGGGAEAIGITATERFEVEHVVATDPPGIRKVPFFVGEFVDYGLYQIFTETRKADADKPDTSENLQPEIAQSGFEVIKRQLAEIAIYSAAWRSTMTRDNLAHIALHQPETAVHVVYPGKTYTADSETLQAVATDLNSLRDGMVHAAPFQVEVAEGAYHSYYDDHRKFHALVNDALNPAE